LVNFHIKDPMNPATIAPNIQRRGVGGWRVGSSLMISFSGVVGIGEKWLQNHPLIPHQPKANRKIEFWADRPWETLHRGSMSVQFDGRMRHLAQSFTQSNALQTRRSIIKYRTS
jgi:hypothetical protein